MKIELAITQADFLQARALFEEYASSLNVDLGFQGIESEFATLPGKYALPSGAIFLALDDEGPTVGTVAIRPFERPGACEMKRLYVRPKGRGMGAGKALAKAAIAFAETAGYAEILLDSLPSMTAAARLYERLGFRETEPYWDNILPGVRYFSLTLSAHAPR
ncbi:GNAT family N-acetyltransferase [Pseudorhodoplanes sinuspersici]|uniref:Uncharacterized protein n=1 Tax=Pseudorhodoplanes sinuspersici TaxID=1235591 RepID=A0A1W6ZVN6_9HYPH|nr:GNAT family N-acetyltransferase [Pseudorhodoplanes sinuspersici]ARQ01201.1 hypothetical protein CAK95_20445 [Pseudorhodoplanes sinuspersici]RKE72863.1 acetyltransferase (GNAT) family protein [Pseudorhodoplanes sinuspersici]